MTKERFAEILKEYGYNNAQVDLIWGQRPSGEISETLVRMTAKILAPAQQFLGHIVQV